MGKTKEHPWIKLKRYPHIGMPYGRKDIPMLEKYITDEKNIERHSFLPFIHRTIFQRRFRAKTDGSINEKSKKRTRFLDKFKAREIYFASHLDAQIYSYYSYLLADRYEDFISDKSFNDSVVAYRKIAIETEPEKNKCNIDFAYDAFQFIKENKDKELSVIIADVTNFFDSLNHKILKRNWARVWNSGTTLPKDHYNVFKSLTRLRYVNEDLLFRTYKDRIWVQTALLFNPKSFTVKQKPVKYKRFLRDNNAIAFCKKSDFIKQNINLISKSAKTKGIPQGTALSATLANIYMLDFDEKLYQKIHAVEGFYQRYSDDLIIVVPKAEEGAILKDLRHLIEEEAQLEIHPKKTKIHHFQMEGDKFVGYELNEKTRLRKNKSLEYLGFEYDGRKVLIKTAGFSKFNRSMKSSFKRATSLAIYADSTPDKLFKNRLYKRFTHKGAKRRTRREAGKVVRVYDWGNFLTYVSKANDKFRGFNGNDAIKKQSRKTWKRFHILMENSIEKIEKGNSKKNIYVPIDEFLNN